MGSTPDGERTSDQGPRAVYNVVRDSAVEYLIQAGYVHGDITVNLPPRPTRLDEAAEALARAVRAQWSAEVGAWQLGEVSAPLAVRWRAEWGESDGTATPSGGTGTPPPASSDRVTDVVATLLSRRHRRLVVLGDPGSGKSTFLALLVLTLADGHLGDLTRHRTGDRSLPVPVFLTLESWRAETTPFKEWLTARITEDHPGLPRVDGAHPAERLIREYRVLPVLDGLDELPEHRRGHVMAQLGTALGSQGLGVVLASRTEAYARLARPLPGASTLTARPVTAEDAADHLTRTGDARRWYPVEREINAHPEGPLAQALSTPLMIWLARRVYAAPGPGQAPGQGPGQGQGPDPAELTDRARLPSRTAIEARLLDGAIPAAFPASPHDPERLHAPGRWNHVRARTWLTYLARRLSRRGITEFAWWQLPKLAWLRPLTVLTLTAVAALCGEAALAVTHWARDDTGGGTVLFPRQHLMGGVMWGWALRTAALTWYGDRLWEPRRRANPLKTGAALRSASRAASARRGTGAAAVLVVPAALLLLLMQEALQPAAYTWWVLLGFVLPCFLMTVLAAPSDTVDAATPDTLLASERRTALLTLGVLAPLIGLADLVWARIVLNDEAESWIAGAHAFIGAAAVLVLLSPWALWTVAKGWLALAGRVPWCLMEFLRDGHTAGLLQRNGGVYRFRHLRLQEHLACTTPPEATTPAPGPPHVPLQHPDHARRAAARTPPAAPDPAALPPMHTLRGWKVIDTDEHYIADGRARRYPLGHWKVVVAAGALVAIRTGVQGQLFTWTGLVVILAWPAFGLLINLVAWCLPPQRILLRIDRYGIHSTIGRRGVTYRWDEITDVAVRPVHVRGRDRKTYGPHVRLRPDPHRPEPPRGFHGKESWYLVMPIHFKPLVPPDISAALARFGGKPL